MPTIDSDELNGLIHSLWRDVTNFEDSEEVPRLQLGAQGLDFGNIRFVLCDRSPITFDRILRYKQVRSRTLRVANVGKVSGAFSITFCPTGLRTTMSASFNVQIRSSGAWYRRP